MNPTPTRTRSVVTRLIIGLAAGALVATAAPAHAAPDYTVKVAKTPRGPAATVPLIHGNTLRDGAVKMTIPGAVVRLVGSGADTYIVGTTDDQGTNERLWRYAQDGSRTLLLSNWPIFEAVVSDDGSTLAVARQRRRNSTVLVMDATTGDRIVKRRLTGSVSPLDVEGDRVALGRWSKPATLIWRTDTDRLRRVSRLDGYAADLAGGRFAGYTGDPYDGGCSVVRTFGKRGKRVWRSCVDRVAEFAQGGRKMATIDLLSDGIGPGRVTLRGSHGRTKATFDIRGYFGLMDFEPDGSLLVEANGRKKAATLRATRSGVERVTRLRPAVWL